MREVFVLVTRLPVACENHERWVLEGLSLSASFRAAAAVSSRTAILCILHYTVTYYILFLNLLLNMYPRLPHCAKNRPRHSSSHSPVLASASDIGT